MFRHQIKHREAGVENTTCSGVFLTNFEVIHLVMKHCVECLILLLKQMILEGEIKDAKMTGFSSDFQTLIKQFFFVFSL